MRPPQASRSITWAGSFTIGSINLDTSGVLAGTHTSLPFLRSGVDGVTDKFGNVAQVQVNGAIVWSPEPATARLVSFGLTGPGLCA
jgi:hypothetical protein